MFMYEYDTVYIVGDAKSPENNPITKLYEGFFIIFVINRRSGEIQDAECSAAATVTKSFVASMLIGKNILDSEVIANEIKNRYFGSSQKALIVALRDAQKKYNHLQSE